MRTRDPSAIREIRERDSLTRDGYGDRHSFPLPVNVTVSVASPHSVDVRNSHEIRDCRSHFRILHREGIDGIVGPIVESERTHDLFPFVETDCYSAHLTL